MDRRSLPMIPPPGTISSRKLYRFSRTIVGMILRTWLPTTIRGVEHIPSSGGAIIASNHLSLLDVPLLGYAIGRESRFPAKPELFDNPVLAQFLLSLGGFPISRGEGDRKALSFSEQVIREGGILAIFPEGTRSRDGSLGPFHRGVALLAMGSGVPIIPAAISGSDKSLSSGRIIPKSAEITITFGSPEIPRSIPSDPVARKEESLRLTGCVFEKVQSLLANR